MTTEGAHIVGTRRLEIHVADAESGPMLQNLREDPRVIPTLFGTTIAEASRSALVPDWQPTPSRTVFAARNRTSGELVGGLRLYQDKLSYFIDPRFWARGYGGEAVTALVARLWEMHPTEKLRALVARENMASRRILDQTGFEFAGLVPGTGTPRQQVPVLNYVAKRPGGIFFSASEPADIASPRTD